MQACTQRNTTLFVAILGLTFSSGCERQEQAPPQPTAPAAETPGEAPAETPAEAPPASPTVGRNAAEDAGGDSLAHQGIVFTIPEGWQKVDVDTAGQMALAAAYTLPAEGEASPAEVRVTYFPNMKGMDDANINRWVQMVTRNGAPAQLSDAKVIEETQGMVRLKIVDLEGEVRSSMGDAASAQGNQRLIAAIVDHPQGPHFVRVTGDVGVMAAWADSVYAFLRSAEVQ